MSEGMKMALLILFVFFVVLPMFVLPQIRRENKWEEGRMIDPEKDRKAQVHGEADNKDKRDF
jgi:hypothetical protein